MKENSKSRLVRYVQVFLTASGVIGLVSLHEDIIRWSSIANWVIEAWRSLAGPAFEMVSALIGWRIPPFVHDIALLFVAMFAAANAYSFEKYRRFVFIEAVRIFWMEQFSSKGYDHDIPDRFALFTARAAIGIALSTVMMVSLAPQWYGLGSPPRAYLLVWPISAYTIYGFFRITGLKEVDEVPEEERSSLIKQRRKEYAFFLPGTLFMYLTFLLYSLLLIVFAAWRFYIYVTLGFVAVFALNELYLRTAKIWVVPPHCLVYSIEGTCRVRGVAAVTRVKVAPAAGYSSADA
jgi:hypothetical protein